MVRVGVTRMEQGILAMLQLLGKQCLCYFARSQKPRKHCAPEPENIVSLDSKQIRKVAMLARLRITAAQLDAYTNDLSGIMDMMDSLETVDTHAVEPMAHPLELTARLRADRVSDAGAPDQFQAIAPAVEQGLYLVPRVIE